MVTHYGLATVIAYMGHVQDNAEESVRRVIDVLKDGNFTYPMDNGQQVKVAISINKSDRSAIVDFTGTSKQGANNFNAPAAVCRAAVLYVFRTLVADDIPMNEGCLKPVQIILPDDCMLKAQYPAAVIAGALMLRGLNPGPELFGTNAALVYSFGWSLLIAGIIVFFIGMIATPLLVKIIKIPLRLLAPLIMFLAIIGAYAIRNNIFDVYLMLIIGVFVFLVRRLGFHPGPIGLGLILGPIIEPSLVQSLYISHAVGVQKVFFTGSVNIILISLSVISVSAVAISRFRSKGKSVVD